MANTLVGFGASTMQGAGDLSQKGFFNRIQAPLLATRPGLTFINHGIGGNTTRDMLCRVEKTEAIAPRDLVVILGCNDMPRDNDGNPQNRLPLEQYESNLTAILPRIKGERSLFVSSFPIRWIGLPTFDRYMDAATRIATNNGYEIWDLYRQLRGQDLSHLWAPDGVHFNDAGHQLIADGVIARLS